MKPMQIGLSILLIATGLFGESDGGKNTVDSDEYVNLSKIKIEKNSDQFKIYKDGDEELLGLKNNFYNEKIDPNTGKKIDDVSGKVILLGKTKSNYSMTADMKFLGANIDLAGAGWFGFVIRAQDCENYELVWFMPKAEGEKTIAYLPVAHGIVPWWTESYASQEKGDATIPSGEWFTARVDVIDDAMNIYVNNKFVFKKSLTYYLKEGKPGFYVGTATNAAFRRIKITDL